MLGRMTATMTPVLAPLDRPGSMADAQEGIDRVVAWAIEAQSHIGYFAALYKRVTLAIRKAMTDGVFQDADRIDRLGTVFSQRYFDSLNAFFHPDRYEGLTLPWEISFVGAKDDQAIMLQHMMAGLNAHITYDLGLSALATAPCSLGELAEDFNRVNALLCSQIPDILRVVEDCSPELKWFRRLVPFEIAILKRMLTKLRRSAWLFAIYMDENPARARQREVGQAAVSAALGAWYLQPPARLTAVPVLVRVIAKRESPNVGDNIEALEQQVLNTPADLNPVFLLRD
jgi:hypothetical protein